MNVQKILTILLIFWSLYTFGQAPVAYSENIVLAEQQYKEKQFLKAAQFYSKAFAAFGDKGRLDHRYSAGRCWALAGVLDSAFYQLERITQTGKYTNYLQISTDVELKILHNDVRWRKLLDLVKEKKDIAETNLNKPLVAILDSVHYEDQTYRNQIDEIEQKYGRSSEEFKRLSEKISEMDAKNLVKVTSILDKYGWLGADIVGEQGNMTIFLVLQHADINTQEKYLPMMRDAVKQGKASGSNLPLLEDRIALRHGRKQIYGSQIGRDMKTGRWYVLPLEDPENVDKRRTEVNLPPMKDYVINWGIIWNIEQYKKDLSEIN